MGALTTKNKPQGFVFLNGYIIPKPSGEGYIDSWVDLWVRTGIPVASSP